ncbi:hypothetical protein ROJ8625_03268 [Roseivivax jejudonensis]|uniref:3-methyl-2-oxobutanoate hydroxymethyltransferase n=1 Tax=Roseivivax jejudonensis TaxID=1529041 RepID=A0A1X6ZXU2_9RHOB|nr:hypothetical protein [Roseivivax jejudonensis]SLN64367.1 hypothetical protein ROJ8625_03268 [Roseivivax jejudonensis]
MPHDSDDIFEADNATRRDRGPVDHPTMLSSCSRAATAEEARYRVQYPNSMTRSSRIFALDEAAAEAMYGITEEPWNDAHFLTLAARGKVSPDTRPEDLPLSRPDGAAASLLDEIEGADVVVLLASDGTSEGAAEVIARECFERRIMCAGLALGQGRSDAAVATVVNSMRRFARVLVVAQDDDFIPAMLTALRA